MKMWRTIAILALAFGIGLPAIQAGADVDFGPLMDAPAVKGTSAYTFLKIGASPRAVGMGEAYTAVYGNVDAIFYNPASLGFIKGTQYMLSYTDWLVNSKIYTGAIVHRFGNNVFGVSVVNAKPEAVKETTDLKPLGTGNMINASDIAIGVAYARQMTDKVSWGGHARYVREDLFLVTSSSYQFDLGISAYTGYKSLRVAASARNVGGETTVEVRSFSPPIYFNFAVAAEIYGDVGDPTYLTVATETLFATDYGQRWHFGGELWLGNILALRGGYRTNYDVENYSLGAGLKHKFGDRDIRVDVSYTEGGEDFAAPLRVSLGGSF